MTQHRLLHILAAILYCCIVFGFMLGARPLSSPDETRYSSVSVEMLRTHDYVTPRVNGIKFLDKPILYYWAQAFSIHHFGIYNWSLRLASAVFALLTSLGVFLFALKFYDRKTAWLSLLILSTSPLFFFAARYINMDMAITAWITLCLLSFQAAVLTPSHIFRKLFVYSIYVFAALGFLTKGLIGFVIPGLVILVWMIWERRWEILQWVISPIGILLFLIITLPWLFAVQKANSDFFHYFFVVEHFQRFHMQGFNNPMPWWFYLPVILIGMLSWSLLILARCAQWIKKRRGDSFLIIWTLVVLLFFSIPSSKIITYILPLFPPLALLIARFIGEVDKQIQLKNNLLVFSFLIYGIIASSLFLFLLFFNFYTILQPFRIDLILCVCVLFLTAFMSFCWLYTKNWMAEVLTIGISTLLLLAIGSIAVAKLPDDGMKNFASILEKRIHPNDKLVTYEMYPYALPIYLNHRVIIVMNWDSISDSLDNWKGHFHYGATKKDRKEYLITARQFLKLWIGKNRVYVIIPIDIYNRLKVKVPDFKHVLGMTKESVLLEN